MAAVLGGLGAVAIALVLLSWWLFSSTPSPGRSRAAPDPRAAAAALVPPGPASTPAPTPSFVVPTPSYATPSLASPLGPLEPEVPGDQPIPTDVVATPAVAAGPPSRPTRSTTRPPAPSPGVADVRLSCQLKGRVVRATLVVQSGAAVPVSLTAAGDTRAFRAGPGRERVSVIARAGGPDPSCSAVVAGQAVGPIPAR